jgi:hypothetical protein
LCSKFTYFYIAAGLTLVFMGAMSLVMDTHHHWSKGSIIRFTSHLLIGMAVALVSLLSDKETGINLLISPWIIPIFLFSIMLSKFDTHHFLVHILTINSHGGSPYKMGKTGQD